MYLDFLTEDESAEGEVILRRYEVEYERETWPGNRSGPPDGWLEPWSTLTVTRLWIDGRTIPARSWPPDLDDLIDEHEARQSRPRLGGVR